MSKRRVFGAFLIIAALLVMLIPAAGADAATSASAFTIQSGELTKYNGKDKTVTVPDTVISIGKGAFENNTYVEKIILPDSVEQIKAYAFWGCDNLRTVTLGKGLSTVGDFAFTNCTGLENMTIPENVHSIGIQAFSECKRFEDITIPPQVVDIRDDAFDGDYLLNIHCETGSYADKYAKSFYDRQKKMSVYGSVPGELSTGGSTADHNAINGTDSQITVRPGQVPADGVYSGADVVDTQTDDQNTVGQETPGTVIGSTHIVANQAVVMMQGADISVVSGDAGNTDGTSYVAGDVANVMESALQQGKIPERAHYRDDAFTSANFTDDVKEIGQFAYARSGLQQVTFADGLEKIGYAAFYHCDSLKDVRLPESVNSVEAKAFAHSAWVEEFLSAPTNAEDINSDFLISGGVLVAYRGEAQEVKVPDGVRVIAGEAFADHKEINKIILPASLQTINDRAFAGCQIMDIQYDGSIFSEDALEQSVVLQSLTGPNEASVEILSQTVGGRSIPVVFLYVLAALLFLGGVYCVLRERI